MCHISASWSFMRGAYSAGGAPVGAGDCRAWTPALGLVRAMAAKLFAAGRGVEVPARYSAIAPLC
jgi:hypothetical protein